MHYFFSLPQPVGLYLEMPIGAGIVSCCSANEPCSNFVHANESACFNVGDWCRCQAYPICPSSSNSVCRLPLTASPSIPCPDLDLSNEDQRDKSMLSLYGELGNELCVCKTSDSDMSDFKIPLDGHLTGPNAISLTATATTNTNNPCDDLLRTVLKHEDKERVEDDYQLKRVHSDPVKAVRVCLNHMHSKGKSSLAYSQSLDSKKQKAENPKLRLRASSSRLISHHSSSSEEWFEEVPPSPQEDPPNTDDDFLPICPRYHLTGEEGPSISVGGESHSHSNGSPVSSSRVSMVRIDGKTSYHSDHDDSISAILRTPKVIQHKTSLNNLLITDKSGCNADNKSQGAISDDSSLRADGTSSLVPCPCSASLDSSTALSTEDVPSPKLKRLTLTSCNEKESKNQCCCVVS